MWVQNCSHHGDDLTLEQIPVAILLLGIGGVGKSTAAKEIHRLLSVRGDDVRLVSFDECRKRLAPAGVDPFSSDLSVKRFIYARAAQEFLADLRKGYSLVIDSGLSKESIRVELKCAIQSLRIVHLHCPLVVAVLRDTWRSWCGSAHERGRYLHLRALASLLNPFEPRKFPQPGITYAFEYPACADLHVSTLFKRPERVAEEVVKDLGLKWPIATEFDP
jgi:predicted kinase